MARVELGAQTYSQVFTLDGKPAAGLAIFQAPGALFAIVLAIGIVVDDAIVVVEGAVRNIEKGMPGRAAASAAMRQLLGPIIGITLVLMSVFLPAAFLPGLTGRMYAQFALVIAATAYGFSRVPTGFLPIEDQGYM